MFNEDNTIEQMMIQKLQQNWWHYVPAEELPRKQNEVLVESMVKSALIRLNPEIAEDEYINKDKDFTDFWIREL